MPVLKKLSISENGGNAKQVCPFRLEVTFCAKISRAIRNAICSRSCAKASILDSRIAMKQLGTRCLTRAIWMRTWRANLSACTSTTTRAITAKADGLPFANFSMQGDRGATSNRKSNWNSSSEHLAHRPALRRWFYCRSDECHRWRRDDRDVSGADLRR